MKKYLFIIPIIALLSLTACQVENESAVDEFEEFVVQVEESVKDGEIKDWNEVEQEFSQQWNKLDNSMEDFSDATQDRIKGLENRFENARTVFDDKASQAQADFEEALRDFQTYVEKTENKAETQASKTWDEVATEYREKKNKVEASAEAVGEDISETLNQWENRFEKMQDTWENA